MSEATKTDSRPTGGGFKTHTAFLEREIKKAKEKLAKLKRAEERTRKIWTKANFAFMTASEQNALLKNRGTKKEAGLKTIVLSWREESARLTVDRDKFRAEIKEVELSLIQLGTELAIFSEHQSSQVDKDDRIVKQVFAYNDAKVQANRILQDYLTEQIFRTMVDEKGELRSQNTKTSKDGRLRVMALTNHIIIVDSGKATEAMALIQKFFDSFKTLDEAKYKAAKPLFDLTEKVLVEKVKFKPGLSLWSFIGLDLDAEIFPDLVNAQTLLLQSMRSEKTNKYIRLYERASRTDAWVVVKQS